MIKLLHIAAIWMSFICLIFGQNQEPLSMNEAVQTALDHRTEFQVNKLEQKIAGKQTEVARFGKIPKIYGNYDLQRNLIIPTTPVPAKAFDPSAPEGELTPLQFSTKWTSGAGINASVDVFNPALEGKIAESELQEDISETDTKITKNELKYQVRSAYIAAIIAREQWRLAIADTLSKHQLLDMTLEQHVAGRITDIELNTARNALIRAKTNYLNALKIYETSKVDLFAEMGLDDLQNNDVELTDSIPSLTGDESMKVDTATRDLNLKKITQQQALNHLQADNLRKTAIPTVTLSGFLGANYYENKFNIWKGENWYGNSYLKVGVHIPITEGLDRNKKIEVLDLKRQVLEQNYTAQQNKRHRELIKIRKDLEYTEKSYELQKYRVTRSKEIYNQTVRQFDAGRVLIKEVIDSGYHYQQAKSDYLQALYDHMKARVELTKIVGLD